MVIVVWKEIGEGVLPGTMQRLRPLIAFHILLFSNKESSRQFIVRITLGKSGARFVQDGISPHLPINSVHHLGTETSEITSLTELLDPLVCLSRETWET